MYKNEGKTNGVNERIHHLLTARDRKGMQMLFDHYYKPLVLFSNTFLNDLPGAEDLIQEFFIDLWEKKIYGQFNAVTMASYLRSAVRNRSLNRINKRDVLANRVGLEQIEVVWEEYQDRKDQIIKLIADEINRLPAQSREVMACMFSGGMTYKEAAEHLDVSVSTVKTLFGRSVDKLRKRLDESVIAELLFLIIPLSEKKHYYLK